MLQTRTLADLKLEGCKPSTSSKVKPSREKRIYKQLSSNPDWLKDQQQLEISEFKTVKRYLDYFEFSQHITKVFAFVNDNGDVVLKRFRHECATGSKNFHVVDGKTVEIATNVFIITGDGEDFQVIHTS
ncbi:hypothetical protein LCGC14_0578230 [marine sediment metagenome]|uniref:Uncharacterized protein n=1 Tax=marine sediment metagenome TaxID=412755 RepID=A0A0F9S0T1_9ZZZZ